MKVKQGQWEEWPGAVVARMSPSRVGLGPVAGAGAVRLPPPAYVSWVPLARRPRYALAERLVAAVLGGLGLTAVTGASGRAGAWGYI